MRARSLRNEDIFYDVEDAYVRAGGWLTNEPDTCIQDHPERRLLILIN